MTKKLHSSKSVQPVNLAWHIARQWRRYLPLGLTFSLARILRAEDHVDYRYEFYDETGDRMQIQTHSVYFEQSLSDKVATKGELVYDGISGATPTGGYDDLGKPVIQHIHNDLRLAANVELDWKLGNQTLTPGFAYSKEHDYESYGISLSDAIEFNDKNTILQLGVSHNFDSVRHSDGTTWSGKDSTEGLIGVTQLLSPKDILSVAFTFGNDSGFLSDPYRQISFTLVGNFANPEVRPSHKNKEILFTSLTHHFDSLDASLEGSYRLYHDSYDVTAHTIGLMWHQWFGKHLMVEPLFRIYQQSAASFYKLGVNNLYPGAPFGENPTFYSADYRLSEFYSTDLGLQATVIINDNLRVTAGYHRYEMNGMDKTPSATYPKANIFTVGFSILW
jgi:hypothetical protein